MKRVLTALVLIPLFAYLILWAPQWAFLGAARASESCAFANTPNLVALHHIRAPGLFGFAAGLLVLLLPREELAFIVSWRSWRWRCRYAS